MKREEVDTFLKAYEVGSIARAAQELFVEQGTASKRVAQLEAELGVRLFHRSRGVRRLALTPEGEAFLPIAQRMDALFGEAETIRDRTMPTSLRLVSTHSLMSYHLTEFLTVYVPAHPEVSVTLHTEHSFEAYQLIDTQQADVALVTSLHPFPSAVVNPLFEEPYAVLCHGQSAFAACGDRESLRPEDEVYLPYSSDFRIWHNSTFPDARGRHKITIGTLREACRFLLGPDDWCIATRTMAEEWVRAAPDWCWVEPDWLPSPRVAYLVRHKSPLPGKEPAASRLVEGLREHLCSRGMVRLCE